MDTVREMRNTYSYLVGKPQGERPEGLQATVQGSGSLWPGPAVWSQGRVADTEETSNKTSDQIHDN